MIRWGTHRPRSAGRHDGERGAVIIVAAISMTAVMFSAALAVDIGRMTLTKRELQAVADLSSLDAVRALGDRAGEADGLAVEEHAAKLAREAALRNGFDPDVPGGTLDVTVGTFDPDTATFVVTTDENLRNAVRVTAGTTLEWAFAPGDKSVSATAVAMVGEEAGIAVGSFLARLDANKSAVLNGLLTGLLGGSVTLDLVSYEGLADGTVELGALRSALGLTAASVDDSLTTEVTLRDLLAATATALTAQGDSASLTAATPVSTLAAATNPALRLRLGDLLDVAQGSGAAALQAELNVLQLVEMSAQVADSDHFLSVTMPVAIPGVTHTSLELALIEAPRIAIGPARQDGTGQWVTRAVTGQVRAQLRLQFQELLEVLGLTGAVSLPVYLEGGGTTAALTDIRCAAPVDASEVDVHTDGQAVRAAVGLVGSTDLQDGTSAVTVADAMVADIPLVVRVAGSGDLVVAHSASDLTFTGPFDWSNTQTTGTATLGLASLLRQQLDFTVTTLTLGVDPLTVENDTRAILNPVLDELDSRLFDPLLSALGINLGGGDVTAWDLDCSRRRLVL